MTPQHHAPYWTLPTQPAATPACAWCCGEATTSYLEDDGHNGVRIHECDDCANADEPPTTPTMEATTA